MIKSTTLTLLFVYNLDNGNFKKLQYWDLPLDPISDKNFNESGFGVNSICIM